MSNYVSLCTLIIVLATCAKSPLQVASFWLTDGSLLRGAPIQLVLAPPQQRASVKTTQDENPSIASGQQQQQQLLQEKLSQADAEPPATATKGVSWIRVDQQQPELQQQQQCQCNVDWIQNQTNSALNKWLASANVANQMRLLVSNSTGASGDINRRDAAARRNEGGSNNNAANNSNNNSSSGSNNNGNHWTAWTKGSKGNNEPGSAGGARTSQPSIPAAAGGATTSVSRLIGAHGHHQQQQQQQRQLKLAQGPRGPPGPKGETGARGDRGEMGPSGMIRVKNRDALFDLALTTTATEMKPAQNGSELFAKPGTTTGDNKLTIRVEQTGDDMTQGLAFIESEQLLVVRTNTGWRPVQLLPALRDFRKTIAKFSLTSPDERRKLLLTAPQAAMDDNSISRPMIMLRPGSLSAASRQRSAAADLYGGGALFGEQVSDEDAKDEDGEAEEDEEEEIDDEEEEDLGEDDAEENGGAKSERVELASNSIKGPASSPARSLRAQPSARSAAAALVSASIENSVTVGSPIETPRSAAMLRHQQQQQQAQKPRSEAGERRMRLRLAALNEPFAGNVHGIRGADFECKRNAAKANVKGSFRALLASGFQNLNEVVRYNVHKYPVVNLRGEILANSWHDLFKQPARMPNPLGRIYSFDGRHVATDSNWPNKLIWHGATNKAGYRDLMHNCDGWHSDSLSKFGFASPLHQVKSQITKRRHRKRHLDQNSSKVGSVSSQNGGTNSDMVAKHHGSQVLETIDKYPCRMPLIVLCIETIGQHSDPATYDVETNDLVANQ